MNHCCRQAGTVFGISIIFLVSVVLPVTGVRPAASASTENVHPRLLFTPDDLTLLRDQVETTHQEIWEPIQDYVDSELGTEPPESAPVDGDLTTYRRFGDRLIAYAFACAVTENPDYCDLAITHLTTYASWTQWSESEERRSLGLAHMLLGNALAYDWLYNMLSPEEQDTVRNSLASWANKIYEASTESHRPEWENWWSRAYMQNHYWTIHAALGMASMALLGDDTEVETVCDVSPAYSNVNLRAGPGTEYDARDVLYFGDMAQVYSEGTKGADGFIWWHLVDGLWVRSDVVGVPTNCASTSMDQMARTWLNLAVARMEHGRDFLNGIGDGSWHESIAYQNYGFTMSLPFLVSLRALEGIDLIPHEYMQNYADWRLYNFLPDTVQPILSFGDFDVPWGNLYSAQNLIRFVAGEYDNGYAEWLAQTLTHVDGRQATTSSAPWYVFELLYYDPTVSPQPPDDRALSHVFPDSESVVWRTGWGVDDMVFALKSGPYGGRFAFETFTNQTYPWEAPCSVNLCALSISHDHDDTNTFYLYRARAWLLPETVGYTQPETVFHNSFLIDGQGQFRVGDSNYYHNPADFVGTDGYLENVTSAPHFDYLASDATRRYRQIGDIQDITRYVVFVRPGYFVMVDTVTADSAHRYEWTAHFGESVTVEDNWLVGHAVDDQVIGINVAAPQPFTVSTGDDGMPYARLRPEDDTATTRFITVLYPTTEEDWGSRPDVELLGDNGHTAALRVHHNDGSGTFDDILITYAKDTGWVEIGPYGYDGRVAVISWEPNRTLHKLFMFGGTYLQDSENAHNLMVMDLSGATTLEAVYDGGQITLYGDNLEGVTLYGPAVENVTIGDLPVPFTRDGELLVLGAQ